MSSSRPAGSARPKCARARVEIRRRPRASDDAELSAVHPAVTDKRGDAPGGRPGWHAWRHAGLDLRLLLMSALLVVMGVVFHGLSGGVFLSPENLYNIAQQTAVVGIVSTVMVLVIVARHIDLSVGSVMGFVGVLIAFLMYTSGWPWFVACLPGLLVAILVSMYQGSLTAMLGVPSFVVTLGGLMSFRGAAFLVADGKTQPVNDEFFHRLGGGYDGSIAVPGPGG